MHRIIIVPTLYSSFEEYVSYLVKWVVKHFEVSPWETGGVTYMFIQ